MNTLDWLIIAVIVLSTITAYRKGFLYTIFQTLSTVIAIFVASAGYKPINSMLRKTFVYDWLQEVAMGNANGLHEAIGLNNQTQFINNLNMPIPSMIQEGMVKNNNPEIYKLLSADNFTEYIGGYIANFYLSIIAFILLLFAVKALIYLLGGSIKTIANLPIINFFDRWLGLILGFAKGVIWVWISMMIIAFLIGFPKFQTLSIQLSQSSVAKWFYENNMILDIIDQLFV